MKRDLVLSPAAEADIDSIWDYTASRWSPAQAERYLTELDGAFDLLRDFPDVGPLRQDITPPARLHPFRRHVILYHASVDQLMVLRVLAVRSDWQALLGD